ncbi:MAG TPA: META domain-containing protein [Cytophaga sp.]|nr:META domain-containing protein [Cytophaga sp.]
MADRTRTDTLSVAQPGLETSETRNPYYNVNLQLGLFQKNISFYAGNFTENWELFIKKDSSFTFQLNGKKTVFEFSKEVQEAAGIRYHSKKIIETTDTTQQKKITITISKEIVPESSGTSHLPFFVTVIIEDRTASTTYSGEGFYISNPALHDIWVLDSLNNEKADTAKFSQGLPRLEFHLNGGKVYGFSGCNELTGTYYTIQNEISINPLVSTMKFCIGTTGENLFLDALNKNRFEYRITNLQLILLHRDKTKLVFKKVD